MGDHTLRKIRRLLLESFAKAYSEYERAKRALFTSLISEERKNQISDKFKEIEAKYQAAEEFFIKTRGETRKDYAEAKSNLKRVRNEFLAL